jgi:starch phosphorylase
LSGTFTGNHAEDCAFRHRAAGHTFLTVQSAAGFSDQVDYSDLTARLLRGAGGSPADEYLLLADFDSYCQAHRRALETYADRKRWSQMSLINIARSGIFAADRSIRDYARDIWHVPARP